jgi:cytochrome c553
MKHPRATALLVVLAAAFPVVAAAQDAAAARGDPAKAQPIVNTVCAACHGADGNSPLSANPSLAGQHASYLYKQLSDYRPAGARTPS